MAQESYPFDTQSVPEDAWTHMARYWQDYGVVGDPGSTALQVTANSSGMQVFAAVGEAIIRGHHYRNTGSVTLAIAANGAGSSRIDRIVLRLNPSTNATTLVVFQGTAGAGVPSLSSNQTDTGLYDLPLAQVTVAAGAVTIANSAVSDDRRFTGVRLLPCRVVADILSPRLGQAAWESTTGLVKVWSGSVWMTLTDASTAQTLTNKTLTSPVINTPSGDVVTPTGVQTLTNKTLTSPTLNTPVGVPWGTLGYTASTTGLIGGFGTETDVPGVTVTVTVGAGRRIRIRWRMSGFFSNVASPRVLLISIKEGGTVLRTANFTVVAGNAQNQTFEGEAILTPSAGAHTYKISCSSTFAVFDTQPDSTNPNTILVEDI